MDPTGDHQPAPEKTKEKKAKTSAWQAELDRLETRLAEEIREVEHRNQLTMDSLEAQNRDLREQLEELRRLVVSLLTKTPTLERGQDVYQPSVAREEKLEGITPRFEGKRTGEELEDFAFDLERYFECRNTPEARRVTVASSFLQGDAKCWWRQVCSGLSGRPTNLEDFLDGLRGQFLPANARTAPMDEALECRHTGSLRDYVKQFASIMLRESVVGRS